jgi:dTDP-D-glucose 4,6-dehydratase
MGARRQRRKDDSSERRSGLHRLQLRPGLDRRGRRTVVNLDKLTYAGNLENLRSLEGDPRHVFVHGDIGDQDLVGELLARTSRARW